MKPVVLSSDYVPSANLIRVDDVGGGGYAWYRVNAELRPVLRHVAARLAPRPAASLHVSDIAPGVPAPTATATAARRQARDSGAGSAWLIVLGAAVAGSAALLVARRAGGRGNP
jgi:hypothetical protein